MEMWKGNQKVVRPDIFKRILSSYNSIFEGFSQHDSQECINSILDILDEKLFRKDEKNVLKYEPQPGLSDEESSERSRLAML